MGCHSKGWYYTQATGNGKYSIGDLRTNYNYFVKRYTDAMNSYENAKKEGADKVLPERIIKNADDWKTKVVNDFVEIRHQQDICERLVRELRALWQSEPNDKGGKCKDNHRQEAKDRLDSFVWHAKHLDRKAILGGTVRNFYGNVQKLEGKANWIGKIVHWVQRVSLNVLIPLIGMAIKTNIAGLTEKLYATRKSYPLNWAKVKKSLYEGFGLKESEINSWVDIGHNKPALTNPTKIKQIVKNLKTDTSSFEGGDGFFSAEGDDGKAPTSDEAAKIAKSLVDSAVAKGKADDKGGKNSKWKPAAYSIIPVVSTAVGTGMSAPWGTVGGAAVGGALDIIVSQMPDNFKKGELPNSEKTGGIPAPSKSNGIKTTIKNMPLWVKITIPTLLVGGTLVTIFRKKIF